MIQTAIFLAGFMVLYAALVIEAVVQHARLRRAHEREIRCLAALDETVRHLEKTTAALNWSNHAVETLLAERHAAAKGRGIGEVGEVTASRGPVLNDIQECMNRLSADGKCVMCGKPKDKPCDVCARISAMIPIKWGPLFAAPSSTRNQAKTRAPGPLTPTQGHP